MKILDVRTPEQVLFVGHAPMAWKIPVASQSYEWITFHLSEVKGPVMDRLKRSPFLSELTGKVHLTHYDAVCSINPDRARQTLEAARVYSTPDPRYLTR